MFLRYLIPLLLTANALADDHELLNQEEREWLDSLQAPLLVGTENYHPYSFVDDQGELSGVVGDYVLLLQRKLGFEFEVRVYSTFADLLVAAKNREVDVLPLIVAAPERSGYLNFTQSAFETRDSVLTRQENQLTLSLDNMGGMRVGMVEGYALEVEIETIYPEIDLVPVADELDGLLSLSLGEIDAYITEIGVATYYIQREAITNLRVAGEVGDAVSQVIATRNDWPILNSIFGKGLASISDEEQAEIQRRWINIEGTDSREVELIWKKVAAVAGLILLLLVAMLIWTLSLQRLVRKRTLELQQELAERRLVEADNLRLAVAVEQSAEFVLVVDTSANIEYANISFLDAYGSKGVKGRPLNSLVADGTNGTLTEALGAVRKSGSWHGTVVLSADNEVALKTKMAIAPIFNDRTEIDGYVVTGRDVTKTERLESRLRQGEKLSALGTLASGIAHDFNNLLVPILGYTEMTRVHSPERVAPYLDRIEDASGRARDLVQRIIAFGRGGTGEMAPLDLRFEIEDAVSFVRSLIPATIDLREELIECGSILGDRTQIQQIVLNLCSNASDAMVENGGTLRINLKPLTVHENSDAPLPDLLAGDYALLTIGDTGIGMSEETKAKIFDPYFSDKQSAAGTGLGLAIVHGIVVRHGGTIHVESKEGLGTLCRIFFPTVSVEPPRRETPGAANIPRGHGETILLIDDDQSVRNTLSTMLKTLGYEVSEWSDAIAAMGAFGAAPDDFDAILTDFTMPGMTGTQVAEQALAIRPDIPVVIMTGNPEAVQDYDGQWIAKPMKLSELAECLQTSLTDNEQ